MQQLTIGMPVFNDIDFIEASLISILKQEKVSFHLIISDDGATDGSEEVCKRYAAQDNRITYIRQTKNLGISKNMEFLLQSADTPYFMWAADDDLWETNFAFELIQLLEKNPTAVSAFTIYHEIDEHDQSITTPLDFNYSNPNCYKRLNYYIKHPSDGFGYGIFKTSAIKDVEFPIWWWPNRKTPYNNIFPTLCYYLALGDFCYYSKEKLFHKRVKTPAKTNHIITGSGNGFKELSAFIIRRFNLITFSTKLIRKGSSPWIALRIYPTLFAHWFIKASYNEVKKAFQSRMKKSNS